jgi:hypothetical protein
MDGITALINAFRSSAFRSSDKKRKFGQVTEKIKPNFTPLHI